MLGSKSAAIVNATTMNEYWMFQKAVYPPQKQWTSISFLQWLQYSTLNFCVQPPCVPMVHSRHLHTPCIGCDSGARNTSGRAPPDLEWSCGVPKILDALATPQSPPAFNQSRIFRKPSTYAGIGRLKQSQWHFRGSITKLRVIPRRNKFEISRGVSAKPPEATDFIQKIIHPSGWRLLFLHDLHVFCLNSKDGHCHHPSHPGSERLWLSGAAQYFSAKKAATPARIQTSGTKCCFEIHSLKLNLTAEESRVSRIY